MIGQYTLDDWNRIGRAMRYREELYGSPTNQDFWIDWALESWRAPNMADCIIDYGIQYLYPPVA